MNFNQWIQRYTSIWWYRMLGLDQNKFLDIQKRHWLVNDINGIIPNFALENIFIEKYIYLDLFILRININIDLKDIKTIKKTYRKNDFFPSKIVVRGKGKKIEKFKVGNKYSIKGWDKFGGLLFVIG